MKFKVGDIVGENGKEDRIVMAVSHRKQEYTLGFINDTNKIPYKWKMAHVHKTYKLKVPSHIPKKQRERYRKLKCQKI